MSRGWNVVRIRSSEGHNVRARRDPASEIVAELRDGDRVYVVNAEPIYSLGYSWIEIEEGYVADTPNISFLADAAEYDLFEYLLAPGERSRVARLHNSWVGGPDEYIQGVWWNEDTYLYLKGKDPNNCQFEMVRVLDNGLAWVYDTSLDDDSYYAVNEGRPPLLRIPRYMTVGERYFYEPLITYKNERTGAVEDGVEDVYFPHYIRLVMIHETWTSPVGVVLNNVAELDGYFPNGDPFERVFFSEGVLVGWVNEAPGNNLEVSSLTQIGQDVTLQPEQVPTIDLGERGSMPETDFTVQRFIDDPDFISKWDNPWMGNFGGENLQSTRVDDAIITWVNELRIHIGQRPPAYVYNSGDWGIKVDIGGRDIFQGIERLRDLNQLHLTNSGVYLFLWKVNELEQFTNPHNLQYGLRFHMQDDTVHDFLDELPAFNAVDHMGVHGLLVNLPNPQDVVSVGLILHTIHPNVQGVFEYNYFNAFLVPEGTTADDLGIDVPVINLGTSDPAPEPEPEPSDGELLELLAKIAINTDRTASAVEKIANVFNS